jgi:hypothetical protein
MKQITFSTGSEIFGTQEMKTEEVVMFATAAMENGCDVEQTRDDIQFIDSLLWYKKRELFLNKESRKTRGGNYRRDSGYSNFMENGLQNLADMARARNEEAK